MDTYKNLKRVISLGSKNREEFLEMMDVFLMNNRINADQYNELVTLISE